MQDSDPDADPDDATPSTSVPTTADGDQQGETKKRKPGDKVKTAADVIAKHAEKSKREREAKERKWFDLKVNTSVYVTGLPEDITETEFAEVSSPIEGTIRIHKKPGNTSASVASCCHSHCACYLNFDILWGCVPL